LSDDPARHRPADHVPRTPTTLSRDEVRAFYDAFGAKQDRQGLYEDAATSLLVARGDFDRARAVFEFGCGTGRFAEELLARHLSAEALYRGCDLSTTMVGLARARVARFGGRVGVDLSDGSMNLQAVDGAYDRFVCNYVFDLLSPDDIAALLREAWRILAPEGLLCLCSLTHGPRLVSHMISRAWELVHRFRARLVGGCRPIELLDFVSAPAWEVGYRDVVTRLGLSSEVLVAARSGASPAA